MEPGFVFFETKCVDLRTSCMALFDAAQLFHPVRARCLGGALNAALVRAKLVSITCLADAQTAQDLVDELPAYLVEVNRVDVSNDRKEANKS